MNAKRHTTWVFAARGVESHYENLIWIVHNQKMFYVHSMILTFHPSIHSRRRHRLVEFGKTQTLLVRRKKHTAAQQRRRQHQRVPFCCVFLVIDIINNNKKCEPVWSFQGGEGKRIKKPLQTFPDYNLHHFFSWCFAALHSSTRNSTQNPIPFVCTILFRSQKTHFSALRFYWAFIPSCPTSFFLCCSFHFHSLFSSRSLLILSLAPSSSSCTRNTLKKEGYNQSGRTRSRGKSNPDRFSPKKFIDTQHVRRRDQDSVSGSKDERNFFFVMTHTIDVWKFLIVCLLSHDGVEKAMKASFMTRRGCCLGVVGRLREALHNINSSSDPTD